MSRKATGTFQQQELRERLRRLEREIAELKSASEKDQAKKAREATKEQPPAQTTGSASKPESS
jgi:hypothetical protein